MHVACSRAVTYVGIKALTRSLVASVNAAVTYWIRMLTPLPDQNRNRERRMFGEGNFRADRKRRKPKPIRNIPNTTLCHALLGKDSRDTIAVARIPRLVAATGVKSTLCQPHHQARTSALAVPLFSSKQVLQASQQYR
jgi:hypothetical protein